VERARSEAGRKINSLTESVGTAQSESLAESLIHGQLELIAIRKTVAEVGVDLRDAGGEPLGSVGEVPRYTQPADARNPH